MITYNMCTVRTADGAREVLVPIERAHVGKRIMVKRVGSVLPEGKKIVSNEYWEQAIITEVTEAAVSYAETTEEDRQQVLR